MSTIKTVQIDLGDRSYDIHIGENLLPKLHDLIPDRIKGRPVFIIADKSVSDYAKRLSDALTQGGEHVKGTCFLDGGEPTKSWSVFEHTCEWLLDQGIKRDSVIYAIGGGVIGDLVGYVAASILRGVDFVQVPTTLLAQVDSSVGGKTGINTRSGKNLVGAFYQPSAVIADMDVLKTLPERQIQAGYAEIAKYAFINQPDFFNWLEAHGAAVCNLDESAISYAVEQSVKAKAAVVQADERESGQRALLNLGHTFGHVLEAAAGYDGRLLHGEAVSIGIVMAFEASCRMGLCSADDAARVKAHYQAVGLPVNASDITPQLSVSAESLVEAMKKDKKADRNSIKFILARGIGQSFVCGDADMDVVKAVIKDSLKS